MRENWKAIILIGAAAMSPLTQAITAPVPTTPSCTAHMTWTLPTTRTDGSALAVSELKETRIYIASLANYIAIAAPAHAYDYVVAPGKSTAANDSVAATAVDTNGIQSAASASVQMPAINCPKPSSGAPTSLVITPG